MHQYTESGLSNIWLYNGYHHEETNLEVDKKRNLHYVIACKLIDQKAKLTPEEFKFLRNEIEATQRVIANAMGVSESTVRNWEHGRSEISPIADRMMRLMYRSCVGDKTELISMVNQLMIAGSKIQRMVFKFTNSWIAN